MVMLGTKCLGVQRDVSLGRATEVARVGETYPSITSDGAAARAGSA